MKTNNAPSSTEADGKRHFWVYGLVLFVVLSVLFYKSFLPDFVHFNNDSPLGAIKPMADNLATVPYGRWSDLNSLGVPLPGILPCVSGASLFLFGAVGFAKFYAPIALLTLGLCAWFFFRQLGLSPLACFLGGLAAALVSDSLATACWGVAGQCVAFGTSYLALAMTANPSPRGRWVRVVLAGMAVGMGIIEALDIGAIFSVVVAACVMYQTLTDETRTLPKRVVFGAAKVAAMALCALWISAELVSALIPTQITGVAGMKETPEAKAQRWDWATQWSLPKREILELAVPGIFGYRMDSSQHGLPGGDYWGAGGRDPAWDRFFAGGSKGPAPGGAIRFGGGGLYAGILVVVVATWAGAQALRKQGSVFSRANQKALWFWLGLMVVSVLLAFGRYAPFYWFVYQLPGVSFIRNPAKFIHVFNWGLVVVFAYGVHGLSRRYMDPAAALSASLGQQLRSWWSKAGGFDRKWALGCVAAIGVSLVGWWIYSSSRVSLEAYLEKVQIPHEMAKDIAGFSIDHVGWFVPRLVLAVGLVAVVLSGYFAGARARWGGLVLGLFLVMDLGEANQPWILHWNVPQKYATNPILDRLRERPYEYRVVIFPRWIPMVYQVPQELTRAEYFLDHLYGIEWAQHHFQYYGIQSLDLVQMPRMPADLDAFEGTLQFERTARSHPLPEALARSVRRWELTNTRYVLGAAPFLQLLNQGLDPGHQRFKIAARFDIVPKDPAQANNAELWTAVPSTNGTYALFEFTGALPRAKLYTNWQVSTNDQATLDRLADPAFDPAQTVLVASPIPPPVQTSATNSPPSTNSVEFTSYSPVKIVLRARADAPSILLLNDRFDPGWEVAVDGKREPLLRCNYIMRGVQVPAGEHRVEFRLTRRVTGLYVNLAALATAIMLVGYLAWTRKNASLER